MSNATIFWLAHAAVMIVIGAGVARGVWCYKRGDCFRRGDVGNAVFEGSMVVLLGAALILAVCAGVGMYDEALTWAFGSGA